VRQFLDIGTGIPTAGNTHQVAQVFVPESRVVYVDYEAGATEYIHADLRDTDTILDQGPVQQLNSYPPTGPTTSGEAGRTSGGDRLRHAGPSRGITGD
jgi:hypothetical protein